MRGRGRRWVFFSITPGAVALISESRLNGVFTSFGAEDGPIDYYVPLWAQAPKEF